VWGSAGFGGLSVEGARRLLLHLQQGGAASTDEAAGARVFTAAWRWVVADAAHVPHIPAVCSAISPIALGVAKVDEIVKSCTGALSEEAVSAASLAFAMAIAGQPARKEAQDSGGNSSGQPHQQQQPGAAVGSGSGGGGGGSDATQQQQRQQRQQQQQQQQQQQAGSQQARAQSGDSHTAARPGSALLSPAGGAATATSGAAPHASASTQPTPTSRAMMASLEAGGAFGGSGGAGGGVDPATAAAAAAGGGVDPATAAAAGISPEYAAAMFSAYGSVAMPKAQQDGAAAASGLAGNGQPLSPADALAAAGWGQLGMPGYMQGQMMGMGNLMALGGMMGGAAAGMANGGGASGGAASRAVGPKGVCQVDGCNADLRGLRDYHLRYKICEYHLKVCCACASRAC
jgi:hypothetical protein